ncbi:MAG: ferrous iron transport protein B [Bacteroidota bacterium]|nr:MAG: ferrous iron transport protein B [Bacteroidota bacterium]
MAEVERDSRLLSDLLTGETGIIVKIKGHGAFRKRITEMGFVKGQQVKVIKNAPLKDPVEYELMGYNVSLRRNEARLLEVVPLAGFKSEQGASYHGTIDTRRVKKTVRENSQTINVAFVGNPNSGKTTLFNFASGARERVGNYGGVTVEAKEAVFKKNGYTFQVSDLPGTYSITEYTPEELYVRKHLVEQMPDVVVNVIDSSNLERNLFLTTQLIDMNIKVVIALNMYDELERRGAKLNFQVFGTMLGIPMVPTVASKGRGIELLLDKIIDVYEDRDPQVRHIHINYGQDLEHAIERVQQKIKEAPNITDNFSSRYLAIKLLEKDKTAMSRLDGNPMRQEILETTQKYIQRLEKDFAESSDTVIADAKYGFIAGALKETLSNGVEVRRRNTKAIDQWLTHKFWGFPIFIFFMWLMFQTTFSLGSYPMGWIESAIGWVSSLGYNSLPEGPLRDLLVNGIIGGVGGVMVFLPNILILFFFISLMEDTGYMARTSFIMDKLMHKIGLHGKSFIPLLMGFGCNVPAVMATRTLESKKDRLLTMLITPFMSCSARLPVYVLLISAFFPARQGLVLFSIYMIGIALAVIVGFVFRKTFFKKQDIPFVMELPPYRIPTLRNTSVHMWHKAVQYIKKMGGVILVASILIWALGYYPRNVDYSHNYEDQIASVTNDNQLSEIEKEARIGELKLVMAGEQQENSYIGRMGHFIEPLIQPLGFDWKIGVSIITGLAAKEIVISTMSVLYHVGPAEQESTGTLVHKLQEQKYSKGEKIGQKVFSPLVAYSFMLFVLIYFPCVAVIAAIKKEGNWKWALFTMFYTTAMAWVISFLVFQIGSMF